jgi:hypothetical protein
MFSLIFISSKRTLFHTISAKRSTHICNFHVHILHPVCICIDERYYYFGKISTEKGKKNIMITRFDHNDDFFRTYFVSFLKFNAHPALLPLGN